VAGLFGRQLLDGGSGQPLVEGLDHVGALVDRVV
jgi:hypothetical protein